MKHLKSTLLTLAALLCSTVASAYDFKVDGIFYNITNSYDLTVEVTYESDIDGIYNSYSGDVVIPATVTYDNKVYKVTSIGWYAFRNCNSLTSITLPESITGFGQYAFADCSNLASITIPERVTSISHRAFNGCSSLTSITIPEGVTSIDSYAFEYCSSLNSITLPESVTSISWGVFNGCNNLTDIHIASIESWLKISIGDMGSRPNCHASNVKLYIDGEELTEIVIPSSVTYIPKFAFRNCSSLTSIIIPEGVTSIGYDAFWDCSSLTSITIPEGVTSIGSSAFRNCSSLASVAIAEDSKLTSIGSETFMDCSSLASITLPEGVTKIENNTFRNCSSLASVAIAEDSKLTSIGSEAFMDCSSLTSVTIPASVTSIGDCAFNGCVGLKELIIADSQNALWLGSSNPGHGYRGIIDGFYVTRGLFYGLQLETLYIGRNLTHENAGSDWFPIHFWDCTKLKTVELGNYVTEISLGLFVNCSSLTSINIPEGVTSIGGYAFSGCSSLASITIPEGVTTIGNNTFRNCSSLASVAIAEDSKLTSIGSEAFMDCSSLASITIPEGVTTIGNNTFLGIKELILKPTTPPTLTTASLISDYAVIVVPKEAYSDYSTATYWADLLARITIDDADARVKSVALTAEADKSALQIAIGDTNLKFVTDLTVSGSINSYDFMVMRNKMPLLRHLDLENASIVANDYEHYTGYRTEDNKFPGYGLYNCKLFSLTFPKNITSVGRDAVRNNLYLSDVTIFEGVTTIDGDAFGECDALTAITLPKGLTTIEYGAFHRCDRLASVTFLDGLTSIGNDAFVDCGALESIVLPPTVTTIGYSAFYGCGALESVVLPPTVKTIGSYAFLGCSNLKEIRIPSSIRSVGDDAFSGCDKLNDVYVYTVEPISIGQNTFAKIGNNFRGTLHAPKVSYWDYYYNTQWGQFASFAEFDEPYENFYLVGDKVLDNNTGAIEGEGDDAPDAEMGSNSGIIVEDNVTQDLGDVDIEHNGSDGGSIIVGGEGCVNADELHFHINVQGGRWYFFCFPFDVRREDIVLENGAEWVFRYYDGEERANNGKGGWKNVTSDGNGNHLKAATGYIFQCSKDDVLILTAKNQKIKHEKKYNELVEHITQNAHDASWNFVGNPYLSYYEVTSDDYSAPITVWDGSKYIAIRPGDDDYQLAPFEAFFVQKPEGVANVDYSPERQHTYHGAQEAAAQARARRRAMPVNPDRLLVNITLGNGTDSDQTRVVFNNEAAMGYETACDAAKFETAGVAQLYTIDSRAVKYAINERPVAEGIVTLGYTAPAEGIYTLAAPRMDTPIYIKDNLTGTIHDFAEGSYEFASEAGTFDDRFMVIMKAGETGIDNAEIGNQNSEIYNVKGQRVNEATEQGIYIKDNRKVVKL